jgi:hypothetical protein
LTRTLFIAPSGIGFRVEVRDLLVGPRQTTSLASLPGAAIFEVCSGGGIVTLAGDPQEVQLGSTFATMWSGSFIDIGFANRLWLVIGKTEKFIDIPSEELLRRLGDVRPAVGTQRSRDG